MKGWEPMLDEAKHAELIGFAGGAKNVASETDLDDVLVISVKDQGLCDLQGVRGVDGVISATLSRGTIRIAFTSKEGLDMAGKYHDLAGDILENVGGLNNVSSLTHCITRLRFRLKDEGKANKEVLEGLDGVIQVMQAGGQYQVVVGAKVDDLYDELLSEFNVPGNGEVAADDDEPVDDGDKKGPLAMLMGTISGVMGPVLMPMAAAGMIKGVVAFCASLGLIATTDGVYQLLYGLGDGFFYFLPIILGYTASKHFHCNELTGMVLGAAYLYPALVNLPSSGEALGTLFAGTAFEMSYYSTFFGIPIIYPLSGYTMSVFPIIITTFFAAKLENVLRKSLPELIRNFATPVIVFAIMVCAQYIIIGPVASLLTSLITFIVSSVYAIPTVGAPLCCMLIGGIFSTLVMFGLHWAMMPISLNNMAQLGYDPLVGSGIGGFVALGQCLAVAIRTKNERRRAIAIPGLVSQFCGVGEPLLYGIQIPTKFIYVQNIVFSAIGGLLCGIFGVKQFINGGMGFFSLPSFVDPATNDAYCMYAYAAILGVLMVAAFIFTMLTYHDDGCYLGKSKAQN